MLAQTLALGCQHTVGTTVGTACSGTDSPIFALEAMATALRLLGFSGTSPPTHVFSCECDPAKQKWIEGMCSPLHLFTNIGELGQEFAHDMFNYPMLSYVPPVTIFIAGFSCKSVSGLNLLRSAFKHACEVEEGETGITFSGVRKYLSSRRPNMFLLENVVGLRGQLDSVESE